MAHSFGKRSRANLAACHPALQTLLTRALAVSPSDFSVVAGAGLTASLRPFPETGPLSRLWLLNDAVVSAAALYPNAPLSLVTQDFAAGVLRVELMTQEPSQEPPTPLLEGTAAWTSIARGGPAYEKLIVWLKAEEGLALKGHWDKIGKVWDIGHGYNLTAHGVPDNEARNLVWTPEQADKALRAEVEVAMTELEAHWPRWNDEFDPVRQAVFASGVYQLGVGGAAKFKNTIACLRAHDFEGAVRNLNLSQWARQTPNRVSRITQMLLTGQWPAEVNGVRL